MSPTSQTKNRLRVTKKTTLVKPGIEIMKTYSQGTQL